ncbi:Dabb family protein [Sinorhizobium meliloti]|uniref:Dabb family protein n=1 Tax=Rhizobium meliloti TaxID=382 RepID=UPI00038078FF|nr:Dabb family protein [Sinorhizobium meliloti]
MILHTHVFSLRHVPGSVEEKAFLEEAHEIAKFHGVRNFNVWRQISSQTQGDFGISMEFENKEDFEEYMKDRPHLDFAFERWFPAITVSRDITFESLA